MIPSGHVYAFGMGPDDGSSWWVHEREFTEAELLAHLRAVWLKIKTHLNCLRGEAEVLFGTANPTWHLCSDGKTSYVVDASTWERVGGTVEEYETWRAKWPDREFYLLLESAGFTQLQATVYSGVGGDWEGDIDNWLNP